MSRFWQPTILYIEQDFFRAALIAQPGIAINVADLTTRSRFVKTEFYRKVAKRYRIEWALGTLLVEPLSSLYEFLTLWRHDPKKPFSEIERQAKELLMPHLAEAHRVARLREVLGEAREGNSRWAIAENAAFYAMRRRVSSIVCVSTGLIGKVAACPKRCTHASTQRRTTTRHASNSASRAKSLFVICR